MQEDFSAITPAPLSLQFNQICSEPGLIRAARRTRRPAGVSRMRVALSVSLLLCLCLGLTCVVLVCVWSSQYRGGFKWDGSGLEFNWHPVLMTAGLVVLYGYSSVLYRVPFTWSQSKQPWKLLHSLLMLLSFLLSVVGLCAVFDTHNKSHTPNLYSLHSWIGLTAVILFALQWVAGFSGFLLPWAPLSLRKLLKPVHVWLGGSILILSIAACISGINEKLFFVLKGGNSSASYSSLPPEARLANSLGLTIVAFGLVVVWILNNKNWQRPEPAAQEPAYTPLNQEENE